MKFSLNWLCEYVALDGISAEDIAAAIDRRIATVKRVETIDSGCDKDLSIGACEIKSQKDVIFTVSPAIRSDLLGHYGLARELSVIFDRELFELEREDVRFRESRKDGNGDLISAAAASFKSGELSLPRIIKDRLSSCGVDTAKRSSESLLCDYVMLELGAPLALSHAHGATVTEDEEIKGLIKIGGVNLTRLGIDYFDESSNGDLTVYSAIFDPNAVRKYSSERNTLTPQGERNLAFAGYEYSKFALARFFSLIKKYSKELCVYECAATASEPKAAQSYVITEELVTRISGDAALWQLSESVFSRLGMLRNVYNDGSLSLTLPAWRNEIDLNHRISFVRELIRLKGALSYPSDLSDGPVCAPAKALLSEKIRELLTEDFGLSEAYFRPTVKRGAIVSFSEERESCAIIPRLIGGYIKLSRSSYFGFQKTLYAPEGIVAERTSLNVVLGKDSDRASALISDLVSLFDREVFRICETACSDDSHGADASVGDVTILSFDLSGLV